VTWYIAVCRHCGWVIYSNDRSKFFEMLRRHLIKKHRIYETNVFALRKHFHIYDNPEQLRKLVEKCLSGEIQNPRLCEGILTRYQKALATQAMLEAIMRSEKARREFLRTLRKTAEEAAKMRRETGKRG